MSLSGPTYLRNCANAIPCTCTMVLSFCDFSLRSDFVVCSVLCTHTLEPTLFLDADSSVISAKYPAHYLITLDEVSKDHRTYTRTQGRASCGERVEKHNPFVQKERFSILGLSSTLFTSHPYPDHPPALPMSQKHSLHACDVPGKVYQWAKQQPYLSATKRKYPYFTRSSHKPKF
jgi:hypothetical protein